MDGLLLIDKPAGWSSFDVIRKLRPVLGIKKMGHAGTLDPMATGLLIVLIGKATKKQDQFMKQDKRYEAEVTLGATSDTDDVEGTVTSSPETALGAGKQLRDFARDRQVAPMFSSGQAGSKDKKETEQLTLKKVQKTLEQFTGEIEQVPPQHSAIKVDGKRAYKTARAGGATQLKARKVTIHDLQLHEYEYPVLRITCSVSSGTYIRSLARDIGVALGTGAYLSALRRTRIGEYTVEQAVTPEAPRVTLTSHIK